MSQRQWIVILGVWIMFFLFLGVPFLFKEVLAILTGLLVIVMAYRIKFKDRMPAKETPLSDAAPDVPTNASRSSFSKEKNPIFPVTSKDLPDQTRGATHDAEQ